MKEVILLGFISGAALLIGAIMGLCLVIPKKIIAAIMAFGAGVLISALSIDLMSDAFDLSPNPILLMSSFLIGAFVFVVGDAWIDNRGGKKRKITHVHHQTTNQAISPPSSGTAIILGTILDGIPESLVMGATLAMNANEGGVVFVAAVFLSNLPEGISGTIALKHSGTKNKKILFIWLLMLLITVLFTVIGYVFLGNSSNELKAIFMTFASGAILAMLCDSLLPEAFNEGGKWTGFAVACGFIIAFLLTKLF